MSTLRSTTMSQLPLLEEEEEEEEEKEQRTDKISNKIIIINK